MTSGWLVRRSRRGGTLGGFLFFNFYIFSGKDRRMRLVGFVDDDVFKEGKLVHGHQVLGA